MKAIVIVAAALAVSACAMSIKNDPYWATYKHQYGKKFATIDEEAMRYDIFTKNMAKAAKMNEADPTAVYGATKYSDREASELFAPFKMPAWIEHRDIQVTGTIPESYDLRDKGAVTPIKDQGQCGSCWAFCTVAACEAAHFLKHNELISLSESQVVDCDENDHGCNGGWPTNAMDWLKSNGGLMTEADYPYKAYEQTCKFSKDKAVMQVGSVFTFAERSPSKMQQAMLDHGSLAIAIDASAFNSYVSGIMTASSGCSAGSPDHGVTAVGWGVESGTKYWIVKNSWGLDWGEQGYVRIQRGKDACGVEDYPMGVDAL